jgi:DNA primase
LPEVDALLAASDAEVGAWIVGLYHGAAKNQAKPKEYLASRGLEHAQLLERFRIGFADRTLGLRLPDGNTKRGEALRSRLQRLGILRPNGREHLNGRVVVPFWSLEAELTQLYGRTVTRGLRTGTPDHLYLARPLDGIVNPEAFEGEELILCEAPIDALTFWCAGFRNVTTTCGAHSFQPALFEAMRRGRTKRVLVAFDRDDAGDTGTKVIAERLQAQGVACWRVLFPKGMDANQYAQKVQPAANALDLVLRNAEWLGEGKPPLVLVPELPEETRAEEEEAEAETETEAEAEAEEAKAAAKPRSTGKPCFAGEKPGGRVSIVLTSSLAALGRGVRRDEEATGGRRELASRRSRDTFAAPDRARGGISAIRAFGVVAANR